MIFLTVRLIGYVYLIFLDTNSFCFPFKTLFNALMNCARRAPTQVFLVRKDIHDKGHAEQTPDGPLNGTPVQVRRVRQALQAHLSRARTSQSAQQRPAVCLQHVQQDLQDSRM